MRHSKQVVVGVAVAYCAAVVVLGFVPWSLGTACPWYVSVLFFLPVGALLGLVVGPRRWWAAVVFGVLGVAWVEAAQTIWMPTGYGRVEDAGWGSLGIVAGVAGALGIRRLVRRSMRSHEPFRIVTEAGSREIPQD